MNATQTPQEKGAGLEQRVAGYLRKQGYIASTNQRKIGRSGTAHEVDVYATRGDAAGEFTLLVECKAWAQAVTKEVVAKVELVRQDLDVHRATIAAAGGITPGGLAMANQHGIDLWDGEHPAPKTSCP
jgi:Restriction endonuclease